MTVRNEEAIAKTLVNLNQLAVQAVRQEKYKYAIDVFTQSLVLEESLGLTAQMAESFYNLASTYLLMEDYDQAQRKSDMALSLFRQEERADAVAKTQRLQANIAEQQADGSNPAQT